MSLRATGVCLDSCASLKKLCHREVEMSLMLVTSVKECVHFPTSDGREYSPLEPLFDMR